MANPLAQLAAINELAYLSGVFNWQMDDGKYTNPNGQTVTFQLISNLQIPIEQYLQGAINTYNLLTNGGFSGDPNQGLFNTTLSTTGLNESISRKYTVNRIPYANYDQPVDLGVGSQRIVFYVVFCGTMYQTAMRNLIQALFLNQVKGLGTLSHPFYGEINNVLPTNFNITYNFDKLNCMLCEIVFMTSDITHLSAGSVNTSILAEISKWYVGIQSAITSLGGTIAAGKGLAAQGSGII